MKEEFCLSSVSSFKAIHDSVANNSATKQQFSFSKTPRFSKKKLYCEQIYNISGNIKSPVRGTAIGYGKKMDFTIDRTCSPAATRYNSRTDFDRNKSHGKGWSLAIGRNKSIDKGHIPLEPLKVQNNNKNPGPGNYSPSKPYKIYGKYTMRKKTKTHLIAVDHPNDNPGPGFYQNPQAFSKSGKFPWSKYQNYGNTSFNPPKSQRFPKLNKRVPGPNRYQITDKDYINADSSYILSKNKGEGKRLFAKSNRNSFVDITAKQCPYPAPGTYRRPSDFGHYDYKKR